MKQKIKLPKLHCHRCGHDWIPRKLVVTVCPDCKSPYWEIPKKIKENSAKTTTVGTK